VKRGTELKLKFKDLAARLGDAPVWKVKGILQALWDFVAENCPHGDVGRFTDRQIAAGIEWSEDAAAELVAALVDVGWLDRNQRHRLVIHDWHEHCEDRVKKAVARSGRPFADLEEDTRVGQNPPLSDKIRPPIPPPPPPPPPKERKHAADKPPPSEKAPPDPRVKTFIDWFFAEYQKRLGQRYIVSGAKEGQLVKTALEALDRNNPSGLELMQEAAAAIFDGMQMDRPNSLELLQGAARAMFDDKDWGRPNASIGLLKAQLNKWLLAAAEADHAKAKKTSRSKAACKPAVKIADRWAYDAQREFDRLTAAKRREFINRATEELRVRLGKEPSTEAAHRRALELTMEAKG
jgi:hypothetical protein